jgi:5'-deoxynucleotidase YfbR-like HD superfamily hydrolase
MAVNPLKIFGKFGFKHREINADVDTDIDAVVRYLNDTHYDVEELLKLFKHLVVLRNDFKIITDESAKKENLKKQIELYDELLVRYEYYDHDVEINGIRVKKIAKQFLRQAKSNKLYSLYDKIRKEPRWFFDW